MAIYGNYGRQVSESIFLFAILSEVPNCFFSGKLKSQHFRRLQEFGKTVDRDADCITQFLCFLTIHQLSPMKSFPIPLHHEVRAHLLKLYEELEKEDTSCLALKKMVHHGVWLLLSKPSPEYLQDGKMCPYTRFLIAAHLQEHGQFVRAHAITPSIAQSQWCFRTSVAQQTLLILDDFDGDALK